MIQFKVWRDDEHWSDELGEMPIDVLAYSPEDAAIELCDLLGVPGGNFRVWCPLRSWRVRLKTQPGGISSEIVRVDKGDGSRLEGGE